MVEAYVVTLVVDVAGISDRFASALLGTLFDLAFTLSNTAWSICCGLSSIWRLQP